MAGYGFIRFSLGLLPVASEVFTPLIYTLSVIAIIFTSLIALMQEDMKKLIAYSSVAHMGFVTLGIFTLQQQGIEGSIIQMISHGLVSAALFLTVGVVYDRMHSRLISTYGGLVSVIPKYSILFMLFALASLGLPGTSGFIGEFLILMGAPINIKNSPIKPLVPGKPSDAKANNMNSIEYFGITETSPPYVLINLECILS